MTRPLVTLSLPTIGRLHFLETLREAIAAQTLTDFELLVLDNACAPEARTALAQWARSDARVRHVPVDIRLPMFANFNRGLQLARGRYVVTMNDDDVYAPRFLEKTVAFAEEHPTVGFVGCNLDYIDAGGALLERRRRIRRTEMVAGRTYIRRLMRSGRNVVRIAATLFRREMLGEHGFDERLSPHWGDFVIMMRVAERSDVGLVRDALVSSRRHDDQASLSLEHAMRFHALAGQLRGYLAEYRARWPGNDEFTRELEDAFVRSNRIMSLWGWLTAPDEVAAEDCLDALEDAPVNQAIFALLARARDSGLDAGVRRALVPFVRRVGNAVFGP